MGPKERMVEGKLWAGPDLPDLGGHCRLNGKKNRLLQAAKSDWQLGCYVEKGLLGSSSRSRQINENTNE